MYGDVIRNIVYNVSTYTPLYICYTLLINVIHRVYKPFLHRGYQQGWISTGMGINRDGYQQGWVSMGEVDALCSIEMFNAYFIL